VAGECLRRKNFSSINSRMSKREKPKLRPLSLAVAALWIPVALFGGNVVAAKDTDAGSPADGNASAQTVAPCIGTAGSPICQLHEAAGADGVLSGEQEALALMALISADMNLSPLEGQLLRQLIQAQQTGEPINVNHPDGRSATYGPPDETAVQTITYIANPPDLTAAMNADAPALLAAAIYADKAPFGYQATLYNTCATQMQPVWEQSTMRNGYKPYRDAISASYDAAKTYEGAQFSMIRTFLYNCYRRHNERLNGALPAFTYDWLK